MGKEGGPSAPVARRVPHREVRHGVEVVDPYHWLRDDSRRDPSVLGYLREENAYTEAVTRGWAPLSQALFAEFTGRIQETDSTVPVRLDDWYYYDRTVKGKQYRIHCRKRGSVEGVEEIVLDENVLAEGHEYFRLGVLRISPDHRLMAYAVDTRGSESFTIRIKELHGGELLDDRIEGAYDSLEWSGDGRSIFYNTIDAAHRPYRLYRHRLGDPATLDELLHEEADESFFLSLYKTRSRRYLMLSLDSHTTSEVRFLDAERPEGAFRTIHPRQQDMEYVVGHRDDRFYIVTNDRAVNFKLVAAPVADPSREHWTEVIPHRREVKLDAVHLFANHMVVVERKNGLRGLRVFELPGGAVHEIEFPEAVYAVQVGWNPEFDSSVLRFGYESLTTPPSVFDYDMRTRQRVLRKEQEVLGGYDRTRYVARRLFAEAPDGTAVPISLVHGRDFPRDGSGPLLLYGYGSYGHSVDPTFSHARVSLLERGVAFAIAHVRGGGEMGRPWYEQGRRRHKRNTFTDFVACAEKLIGDGYTSPGGLAIMGGSAGGLLMGAVVNLRPDLFRAVVAKVPFVDVVNTMFDASLPLTVIEWEEWGDPRKRSDHDYIRSYSPYDNVEATAYPHMLVTSGLNDPRVAYWEPAKWVARLRATKTDGNLLLLKTNLDAGHGGASGRYDHLEELAFEYAFLLERLGIGDRIRNYS